MKKAGGNVDGSCVGVDGVGVCVLLLLLLSLLLLLMWVKRRVVPVGRWNTQVNTLRLAWQSPLYTTMALRSTVTLIMSIFHYGLP